MTPKQTIVAGAVFGFLSVAIGAFAAHGLQLEDYAQNVFETGVKYQFYHALALILIGVTAIQKPMWVPNSVPALFAMGIVIFSGSLYILAVTQIKWMGAITPLGGVCFLIGWLMLIVNVSKSKE